MENDKQTDSTNRSYRVNDSYAVCYCTRICEPSSMNPVILANRIWPILLLAIRRGIKSKTVAKTLRELARQIELI